MTGRTVKTRAATPCKHVLLAVYGGSQLPSPDAGVLTLTCRKQLEILSWLGSAYGEPDAELLCKHMSSMFSQQKRTTLLRWCHTHAQKCAAVAGSGACVAT